MGQLHYFLGMTVIQNETKNSVWIGQPTYTEKLLEKFGMQDCNPVGTPVDVSSKLLAASSEDEGIDQQLYQSVVGSLMYLSVSTRPDITYAQGRIQDLGKGGSYFLAARSGEIFGLTTPPFTCHAH